MGKMWKHEPGDYDNNGNPPGKDHLKGPQFEKYTSPITKGYDFDNDGNPIIPEPEGRTRGEKPIKGKK